MQLRSIWHNDNYFARWKEVETYVEGYQIQMALGEKEIPLLIKSEMDSVTSFALELWFKFVIQFKLRKDEKVLQWIAVISLHNQDLFRYIQLGNYYNRKFFMKALWNAKVIQPYI